MSLLALGASRRTGFWRSPQSSVLRCLLSVTVRSVPLEREKATSEATNPAAIRDLDRRRRPSAFADFAR
jgi:hypothetical protein